jgi:PTH1 family peptidyl-tRNA hydrolase
LSSGIQLIVGLGNPGADYENTRHNAGAWFVLDLAHTTHTQLRHETKFHGLHGSAHLHGHDVHLLIPTTYMNLSGQSVGALANYYKIPPETILVAHDEIDLAVGDIRLKFDGGHGGHNGLRDIIRHLNSNQFHRLRVGVGHPGNSKEVVDYVLNPPKKSEREQIEVALQEAERVLPRLLNGQYQQATQELHTREK